MQYIEAYQTSDEKIFKDKDQAVNHQVDLYGELLDGLIPRYDGTEIDRHKKIIKLMCNADTRKLITNLYLVVEYMKLQELKHSDVVKVMTKHCKHLSYDVDNL